MAKCWVFNDDAVEGLKGFSSGSIQMCVTSPPYFGLRDYGVDGQIGLEKSLDEYVEKLVEVFREVRRVLRDDGTFWLNCGTSFVNKYQESEEMCLHEGLSSEEIKYLLEELAKHV